MVDYQLVDFSRCVEKPLESWMNPTVSVESAKWIGFCNSKRRGIKDKNKKKRKIINEPMTLLLVRLHFLLKGYIETNAGKTLQWNSKWK